MSIWKGVLDWMITKFASKQSPVRPETVENQAAQAALELAAILRVGGALEYDEIPMITRRLQSVVDATNAVVAACEPSQSEGRYCRREL
ncbi:hypothetical protein B1F77_11550 [Pseudomonas syringae]|uniref:Uncharacterized protein n=1 Tax=Pseudomonas syringae TaxID=317 RepID=A0AB37ZUY8_PSESX|nr:hypothetical protein RD00_23410 [Pseudomonas amygdali pv. tabaci]RXT77316.1 hypothetical protein B1F77_11550 [Pseudomonas syringae]RXT81982.1 hypothetical protein B1F72_25675 [Pseudomonas syringae]BCS45815.1 hypothetical protein Pta6605_41460 [Pseudomonas amygdali pv. tabaci]SDO19115.1 hypothetical protein SAMN05444505_1176 [Pseudomonas syringae]